MTRETYSATDGYITAPQIRARFGGRSEMWLWRLLDEDPTFPRPMKIRNMRYWRVADLLKWEERNAATS